MVKTDKSEYMSLAEVAKIIGISRIAVYQRVKKGDIKAIRIGRSYAVSRWSIANIPGYTLSGREKTQIRQVVKKVVNEYGEVLRMLSKA